MKKIIVILFYLIPCVVLSQNSELDSLRNELKIIQSKMQIQKSIDSLSGLLGIPNIIGKPKPTPTSNIKTPTRLTKINKEIDSLNRVKFNNKMLVVISIVVQGIAYVAYSTALRDDAKLNFSTFEHVYKPTKTEHYMLMGLGFVSGTVLQMYAIYTWWDSAGRLAPLEAKKYDLMTDEEK